MLLPNTVGDTLFHLAACNQDSTSFQALIHVLNPDILNKAAIMTNEVGNTPFYCAARNQDSASFQALIHALSPDTLNKAALMTNNNGNTLLHTAALNQDSTSFQALIQALDPQVFNNMSFITMMLLCTRRQMATHQKILKLFDAVKNPKDTFRKSPEETIQWITTYVNRNPMQLPESWKKYVLKCLDTAPGKTADYQYRLWFLWMYMSVKQGDKLSSETIDIIKKSLLQTHSDSLMRMDKDHQVETAKWIQTIFLPRASETEKNRLSSIMFQLAFQNAENPLCAELLASVTKTSQHPASEASSSSSASVTTKIITSVDLSEPKATPAASAPGLDPKDRLAIQNHIHFLNIKQKLSDLKELTTQKKSRMFEFFSAKNEKLEPSVTLLRPLLGMTLDPTNIAALSKEVASIQTENKNAKVNGILTDIQTIAAKIKGSVEIEQKTERDAGVPDSKSSHDLF